MNAESFHERMISKEMRHAYQLSYSMRMITEIPGAYSDAVDSGHDLFARSMIDAFYVHIRLLADFLVRKTSDKDFGPADFSIAWARPESEAAQRLNQYWDIASKYVVHFGHPRVPDNPEELEPFNLSSAWFAAMAKDALTVLSVFIQAVEDEASQLADSPLSPLQMRASYLRVAFREACECIGIDPDIARTGHNVRTEEPEPE